MHEREHLLRWLDAAAARLRFDHWAHAGAALAVVVCAALLLHAFIARVVPVAAVRGALLPLLILSAVAAGIAVLWRARRAPGVRDAARAADARAQLHDELRSAQWFAQGAESSPQIEMLLRRAAHSLRTYTPRSAFPHRAPPALWIALALLAAAVALARWSPSIESRRAAAPPGASAQPAAPSAPSARAGTTPDAERGDAKAAGAGEAERIWSQLKALAESMPDADGSLQRAVAARDAQRAKRIVEALAKPAEAGGSAAPQPKDQVSAEVAQGILERLQQLLAEGGGGVAEAAPEQPNTGRITQSLREDMHAAPPPEASAEEPEVSALDAELRAMSRQNYGPRQTGEGRGEAGQEQGGPASRSGGAMGRRVGVSRAGANDNEQRPDGNPTGTAEPEPVLGARTERLATQLKRVQVPSEPVQDEDEGSEESFFAATRAQSAQAQYLAARAAAGRSVESVVAADDMPLDYRDAARRYTLSQHLREAAARKREQAAAPH